jgi:hypothetical protein
MQASVEKRLLTKSVWWRGGVAQGVGALLVILFFDIAAATAFFGGGLALLLGTTVSALYALRSVAPSGTGAMYAVVVGAVLKWMVVAALLLVAMAMAGQRVMWVFAGLLFAQMAVIVAMMTFKRQ